MADNNGKVGPFFYLSGKILSDSMTVNSAEKYGDFKTWGDHSKFWDSLSKRYRALRNIEYFNCPRGRVTYNYTNDHYYIYLNKKLNRESIISMILKEYRIDNGNYTVDDTDEHYQIIN